VHALIRLRRSPWAAVGLITCLAVSTAAQSTPALTPSSARVALVPLDDRPASLQVPVLLGEVADTQVLTPPRGVLGRLLKTGDGDAIARWLDGLALSTLDAVVISTDMLAYGGPAGSRVPRVFEADARRRLDTIGRLKQRRPDLKVYAFGTILRVPPGAEADTDAWRQTRTRNLAIDLSLVERAASGAIDYLVFTHDVIAPVQAPPEDLAAIADAIGKAGQGNRIAIRAGTDHVALLLLTRALATRFAWQPVVQAVYSSPKAREAAPAIAAQVATAGGRVADRANLQLHVYTSRHETPDQADMFAARVGQAVTSGSGVMVADFDPNGTATGSSLPLIEALRTKKLLPRLYSYASAGALEDTFGTALAHGLLFALAVDKVAPASPEGGLRVAAAQVTVLLHRIVHDFLYEGVVRGQVTEEFIRSRGLNPQRLDDSGRARVERHLAGELKPLAESLTADFTGQAWRLPAPRGRPQRAGLIVKDIDGFTVALPWNRMSDVEIAFGLSAVSSRSQPRPPEPRVLQ
jgi:hypothetical protein